MAGRPGNIILQEFIKTECNYYAGVSKLSRALNDLRDLIAADEEGDIEANQVYLKSIDKMLVSVNRVSRLSREMLLGLENVFGLNHDEAFSSLNQLQPKDIDVNHIALFESFMDENFEKIQDVDSLGEYAFNYPDMIKYAADYQSTKFPYQAQLGRIMRAAGFGNDNLQDFLIMPVQRPPRYRMLCEDLLKAVGVDGKAVVKPMMSAEIVQKVKSRIVAINSRVDMLEKNNAALKYLHDEESPLHVAARITLKKTRLHEILQQGKSDDAKRQEIISELLLKSATGRQAAFKHAVKYNQFRDAVNKSEQYLDAFQNAILGADFNKSHDHNQNAVQYKQMAMNLQTELERSATMLYLNALVAMVDDKNERNKFKKDNADFVSKSFDLSLVATKADMIKQSIQSKDKLAVVNTFELLEQSYDVRLHQLDMKELNNKSEKVNDIIDLATSAKIAVGQFKAIQKDISTVGQSLLDVESSEVTTIEQRIQDIALKRLEIEETKSEAEPHKLNAKRSLFSWFASMLKYLFSFKWLSRKEKSPEQVQQEVDTLRNEVVTELTVNVKALEESLVVLRERAYQRLLLTDASRSKISNYVDELKTIKRQLSELKLENSDLFREIDTKLRQIQKDIGVCQINSKYEELNYRIQVQPGEVLDNTTPGSSPILVTRQVEPAALNVTRLSNTRSKLFDEDKAPVHADDSEIDAVYRSRVSFTPVNNDD